MKKIISIVLVMSMLFAFAVPAFAAGESVISAETENKEPFWEN